MITDQECPVCERDDLVSSVTGAEGLLYCHRCDEHFEEDDETWGQPNKVRKTRMRRESGY